MPEALLLAPMHEGEQIKGFSNVRENDDQQTSSPKGLEETPRRLVSREQYPRPCNEEAYRNEGTDGFDEGHIHGEGGRDASVPHAIGGCAESTPLAPPDGLGSWYPQSDRHQPAGARIACASGH